MLISGLGELRRCGAERVLVERRERLHARREPSRQDSVPDPEGAPHERRQARGIVGVTADVRRVLELREQPGSLGGPTAGEQHARSRREAGGDQLQLGGLRADAERRSASGDPSSGSPRSACRSSCADST